MNFIWYTIHGVLLSHFIVIAIIKHEVPVNTRNATLGYINMMYNDSDSAKDREGKRRGGGRQEYVVFIAFVSKIHSIG